MWGHSGSVKRLDLQNKLLDDAHAIILATLLELNESLIELDLRNNPALSELGVLRVAEVLPLHPNVRQVQLDKFQPAAKSNVGSLARPASGIPDAARCTLGIGLVLSQLTRPKVHTVWCTDLSLDDAACAHIADALLTNTTVTSLVLQGNRIGDVGARRLLEVVQERPVALNLDVGRNPITPGVLDHSGARGV
jgi:hypothetical protein